MEMPQSGERIRGREKLREFQVAYPIPPTIQLRRVVVRKGLWVLEGVNDYGEGRNRAEQASFPTLMVRPVREGLPSFVCLMYKYGELLC